MLYRGGLLFSGGVNLNILALVGVLSIPALAALTFIAACILLPGLVAGLRLQPPLNVTLPTIFCGFKCLVVNLIVISDSQVVVLPVPIQTSAIWKNPVTILIAFLLQLSVLSVSALLTSKAAPLKVD